MKTEKISRKEELIKKIGEQKVILFFALLIIGSFLVLTSCGEQEEEVKEEFLVIKGTKIGEFNPEKAEKGAKIFAEKCAACHKYEEKFVGPPLGNVFKRRSPDYIMSQILDPEKMTHNNDTTKALLKQYMTQMPNQHLSHEEALMILEHLRAKAEGK
ncbi:MAG: cytochrome c [Candidatus Kapabacteria bacterium]|nr:cytochrome c [Candidatus Kapabacteria bacterium]